MPDIGYPVNQRFAKIQLLRVQAQERMLAPIDRTLEWLGCPDLHACTFPGAFYHVILRGNHREALFSNTTDRIALNEMVADAIAQVNARVHAFCWMTAYAKYPKLLSN